MRHSHSTLRHLPWPPHKALVLIPTEKLLVLEKTVRSGRLRAAILRELDLRAGSDRDDHLADCPTCAATVLT